MSLIDKLKKARQSEIKAGKYKLTISRPTDMDALIMQSSSDKSPLEKVVPFVVGWSGVTELDIAPGGTGVDVPFDSELFAEWIKDQPEIWGTLIDGVMDAYLKHAEKRETESKNS